MLDAYSPGTKVQNPCPWEFTGHACQAQAQAQVKRLPLGGGRTKDAGRPDQADTCRASRDCFSLQDLCGKGSSSQVLPAPPPAPSLPMLSPPPQLSPRQAAWGGGGGVLPAEGNHPSTLPVPGPGAHRPARSGYGSPALKTALRFVERRWTSRAPELKTTA